MKQPNILKTNIAILLMLCSSVNLLSQDTTWVKEQLEQVRINTELSPQDRIDRATELFVVSRDLNFERGIIESYTLAGRGYVHIGNAKLAQESFNIALEHAISSNQTWLTSDVYYYLAETQYLTGDREKQIDYLNRSYEIRKEINDEDRLAELYKAYGNLYYTIEEDSMATAYYRLTEGIWKRKNNLDGLAAIYNNLGLIATRRGDVGEHNALMWKSIALNKQTGNIRNLATSYGNLGVGYYTLNLLDSAWYHSYRCYEIRKDNNMRDHMAGSLIDLGDIKTAEQDYEAALAYYKESQQIIIEIDFKEIYLKLYGSLVNLYKITGPASELAHYDSLYAYISDSIERSKNDHIVEEIPAIEDVQAQDAEMEVAEPVEEKTNYLWLIIVIVLVAVGAVFAFKRKR